VKITKKKIRSIIQKIIYEQFTIPTHSKHSGFELFTGLSPREREGEFYEEISFEENLDEIIDGIGDDERADIGAPRFQELDSEEYS